MTARIETVLALLVKQLGHILNVPLAVGSSSD